MWEGIIKSKVGKNEKKFKEINATFSSMFPLFSESR